MNKFFKKIKLELFYLKKALFEYRCFWQYVYHKYIVAKKILKSKKVIDKEMNNSDLSVHVLTGKRDFIMMLWSVKSYYSKASIIGKLFIHSDGSLGKKEKIIIEKILPLAEVIEDGDVFETNLKEYEYLYELRDTYKDWWQFKKLLDPYFVSDKKYRLIIDSDLVWFNRPVEIEDEIVGGGESSLTTRTEKSDPEHTLRYKDGKFLEDNLAIMNSGIVFYKKENLDLDKMRVFFQNININEEKNSHFVEQAAYTKSLINAKVLDYDRYTIKNRVGKGVVVKHYTSPRRVLFYTEGIVKIFN